MPVSRTKRGSRSRFVARAAAGFAALLLANAASAFDPFVVRDIRIEGAQRTEAGTVFSYLPVRVGELLTEDKAASAVRALFATGFFKDVKLEVEGDVLVVFLEERPAVASITISGTKEFDQETIKRALRDIGLAESRIFDRSLLERGEQELKRQYLGRGRYGVRVTSTVTPLERNRVAISMAVEEGETARIKAIRVIGNKAFTEKQLLDEFRLTTPTWLSWYTKTDQYSREKLSGDLEALRSFYLNRGYLEFSIDSTQVSISPDKEDVHLVVSITEGGIYRVNQIRFSGSLLGREDEFRELMTLREGDTFSGQKLSESQKRIVDRLGALGYAFANVNPVPQIDRTTREVSFDMLVDPGRRVYVRRINISGNQRTRDEVIRRELRQFEDAWYDSEKIRLSRERLGRLGYFTDVGIETTPVPEAPDQVDLTVTVKEQPTGAISFGVGLSSAEKLVLSAGLNQNNFLGTGKALTLNLNTSSLARTLNLSYTDPYFTPDGISRSFDLYTRTFNAEYLNLGDYKWRTSGVGLRFGIPYTEVDRITLGTSIEVNEITLGDSPPQRYLDQVAAYGDTTAAWLVTAGWRRDSRDSAFAPTRGRLQNASLELTVPGGELRYVRGTYTHQWYWPINKDFTLALNGDVGVGRGLNGELYPLFKNFYAGGIGSVRGFQQASLGPRDPVDNVPIGGQTRLVGSAEFIFPLPGTGNDRSFRSFVFLDIGNVYLQGKIDLGDLRYSTGVGLNWASPLGPLKLSLGFPLNTQPDDRTQRVQFQIGSGF
jgi:outer membrane protein insertion porin family